MPDQTGELVKVQTSDIFDIMGADLRLVDERVARAATIDFPLVSRLVGDIVKTRGKRLRPLLLLLAARAYTYDRDTLVTAAAGVELLHTASLVHDDSIDRAAIRRGIPTLNTQLSSGAVILIGDYLFAQSAMLAAATGDTRVVSIFASSLGDICDGQLREMLEGHRLDQHRSDYEKRIYGKTAALFAGAAEMGAVIGRAPEADIQALRAFGADLGLAFQIIDDVLDFREQSDVLGKPAGNDLRQGVVTLPTMLFHEMLPAGAPEREEIELIVTGEETDEARIQAVVDEIRASDAIARAEAIAVEFANRARTHVEIVPDRETRALLREVVDLGVSRSS
jgi:geranylgeranyl pyrophosphate synthase